MNEQNTAERNDCGWLDEERADYAMGLMKEQKRFRFEQHLRQCEACRTECDEWRRLLAPSAEAPGATDTSAFAAALSGTFPSADIQGTFPAAPAAPCQKSASPSPTVKRRLEARVRWRKVKSVFAEIMARPAPILTAACCIVGVMLVYGLFFTAATPPSPTRNGGEKVAREDVERHPFLADPETVAYRVKQTPQLAVSGYVWINGESKEMLLWIEGLIPSAERDFQAWAVQDDGRHANIGVLSHVRGIAQLYVQGIQLEDADNIAVSIEPKGGSSLPTSEDSFWVSLKPSN